MVDTFKDLISLLDDVITADQRVEWNNTAQDTKHDGPLARRARALLPALRLLSLTSGQDAGGWS